MVRVLIGLLNAEPGPLRTPALYGKEQNAYQPRNLVDPGKDERALPFSVGDAQFIAHHLELAG
jgi:hypothetical protein